MRTEQDPYDVVPYPSFPYPYTHPDRLAAMAILHGLSPAPVEQCRVLEIGCNEGANLIPMAYAVPGSEFVGFDLAGLPIARGQERIRELGLRNVRLFESNLLDVGTELGQFDYIVAHGLYAWVPEPVREGLLALCGKLLTPDGVAFVSYNALPGGHLRRMIREMMLFQVGDIEDPEQRVSGGLAFLRFLLEARPEGDAYRLLIEDQLTRMEKRSPQVTYHDELSGAYHPVHFVEFVEHARSHGLQYLSEAVLPPPTDPCYRSEHAVRACERGGRRHPEARANAGFRAHARVPGDAALQSGAHRPPRFSGGASSPAVACFTSEVDARRNLRGNDLPVGGWDQDGIEPRRRDCALGSIGGSLAARAEF
jgi:SAM-dependent methyltransferase